MGAMGKYFKNQFQLQMFSLEHESVSDFYLSCWQRNQSALPLLCLRTILFLGCLAILLSSMIIMGTLLPNFGHWFIYLTHWGLLFITLTTGFGFAVSLKVCLKRQAIVNEASFGLPWYIKMYWLLYNITVPLAFLITVFYWAFLTSGEFMIDSSGSALSPTLDIFIHGINSVLMLILLVSSKHSSRLLHVYQPLLLGLIYMVFSIIYYYAGGTDPFGNVWIYPMMDWSDPGPTTVLIVLTTLLLIALHFVVVGIALIRDAITRRYRRNSNSLPISSL